MNIGIVVTMIVGFWSGVGRAQAQTQAQVPCLFFFGDSWADSGNNNQLWTYARANYLPYGIDFPSGPTGRFSNGKTAPDVIAQLLGLNYIPPFANVGVRDIFNGVNYGSAAAGIREETGQHLGGRISFRRQVQNHIRTVLQILNSLGGDGNRTATYLSRCIYSFGVGTDDYFNNYFLPQLYSTSRQYTPQQYADLLNQAYAQLLRVMYYYGARKMVLYGIGPIGCTPYALAQNSPDGRTCVEGINSAVQLFNTRLRSLVDQFNSQLPNARVIYVNVYGITQNIITNPSSFGFRVTNAGCCRVERNNGLVTCLPLQPPCTNRNEFLYWDARNPTEAANKIFANRAYNAQSSSDAYPFDISRLVQI